MTNLPMFWTIIFQSFLPLKFCTLLYYSHAYQAIAYNLHSNFCWYFLTLSWPMYHNNIKAVCIMCNMCLLASSTGNVEWWRLFCLRNHYHVTKYCFHSIVHDFTFTCVPNGASKASWLTDNSTFVLLLYGSYFPSSIAC